MAQPRPAKNDREQWYVKNVTDRTLAISDVLTIPAIGPGKTIDILRFATREQISYSNVLPQLVKMGKVTLRKSIPDSGIDDAVTADTVDASLVPRQYADGEHIEGAESGGASDLGELEDINLTGLLDDQVLQYDAATETWRPVDLSVLGSYGSSDFSNDFALKTTTDLTEGSNLYWTQARFDAAFSAKSTTDLSEGANRYLEVEHLADLMSFILENGTGITWTYDDPNNELTPNVSLSSFTTDDLPEGSNQYLTTERVQDIVGFFLRAGTGISFFYNDSGNEFTINSNLSPFDTDNLSQGSSNLYWSQSLFDAAFASKTTADLSEGGGNDYFTTERLSDTMNFILQDGTGITWTYDDPNNELTPNVTLSPFTTTDLSEGTNLYWSQARFDSAFAAKSTADLSEGGGNDYFTTERLSDTMNFILQDGTGIAWTFSDQDNELTPNVTLAPFSTSDLTEGSNFYYTELRATEQIFTVIENGTGITWNYDLPGRRLTPTVTLSPFSTDDLAEGSNQYYTAEKVDDRVAALLVGGTNVAIVYDDIAGTLTISASGAGGGASALSDLTDVDTTSAANGNILTYVGAADEWRPASPATAGSRNPDTIAYNPDGTISQIDFDDSAVMTFGYSGGRLETITEGSTVKTLQYNGDGQLTGIVVS